MLVIGNRQRGRWSTSVSFERARVVFEMVGVVARGGGSIEVVELDL
jgi:hypothetical protein